jgi:hypothetical protein
MKHILSLSALALLAAGPATAAELKVMQPADRSIVRGVVTFQMKPELGPTDQFLSNPEISIQDDYGKEIEKLRIVRNGNTGVCTATYDTRQLRDGVYLVAITFRTLEGGRKPVDTREDLTLAVRNGPARPGRFSVVLEDRPYKLDEQAEITVKVLDQNGKPMNGARVAFKVDRGDLDTEAEITGVEGEATASIDSDDAQQVTLLITVEHLPPVRRVVRFIP